VGLSTCPPEITMSSCLGHSSARWLDLLSLIGIAQCSYAVRDMAATDVAIRPFLYIHHKVVCVKITKPMIRQSRYMWCSTHIIDFDEIPMGLLYRRRQIQVDKTGDYVRKVLRLRLLRISLLCNTLLIYVHLLLRSYLLFAQM